MNFARISYCSFLSTSIRPKTMPKAPPRKPNHSSKPYTKSKPPSKQDSTPAPKSIPRSKDPKQSHLYTDDNPSTTLHGTGFKDAATAHQTISLVANRSLTYQWQVINTMYCRARGHPSMKKSRSTKSVKDEEDQNKDDQSKSSNQSGTKAMEEAMAIFRTWLDTTYPQAKEERKQKGREFKPLLKKEIVRKYLERIKGMESASESDDQAKTFAEVYANLPKGKRLANVLVDDAHPEEADWDILRETRLTDLVEERKEKGETGEEGLWGDKGGVSQWHLKCLAWAWSPVGERRLPP